jgi:hypothetical protein
MWHKLMFYTERCFTNLFSAEVERTTMITYQPRKLILEDWAHKQPEDSKPLGTWFSPVEEEVPAWREWCEGERWSPRNYTHQYKLSNVPYCNLEEALQGEGKGKVLLLSTEKALWDLTRKFQGKDEYRLRWDRLGPLVSGVEINPFQNHLRFCGLRWYSGWDIASGCIWKQPEGMVVTEVPLDWDGSVKSWNWDDDDDDDEDWDDSED